MSLTQKSFWDQYLKNPNMYAWAKKNLEKVELQNIDPAQVDIQDIPEPIPFEKVIEEISKQAVSNKYESGLQKARESRADEDIVSVDTPEKYDIVRKFISDKGLKIYGGTAIDAHLPEEAKIYKEGQLPDYDFYSPDPWTHAVEIADRFHQAGYKYVEAKAGIHKGTYKVFVDMWPVADITYMPKEDFDRIPYITVSAHGVNIKVVGVVKLFESMYKEFSEPYANPDRWPKVATRQKLLEKYADPLKQKVRCSKSLFTTKVKHDSLYRQVLQFVSDRNMLIAGPFAYNAYMEIADAGKRVSSLHFEVLSETAHQDCKDLHTLLLKQGYSPHIQTSYFPHKELNNTVYSVYIGKRLLCCIIHLTSCTPFITYKNLSIVSIDYLKYELYDEAVFAPCKQVSQDAVCKLQYLEMIQKRYYSENNLSETDPSPFQRFLTTCRGPFRHNIKTEILRQWQQRIVDRGQQIRTWTPLYKIVKTPRKEIPPECRDKAESDCAYPCTWYKKSEKCGPIPKTPYRPGMEILSDEEPI